MMIWRLLANVHQATWEGRMRIQLLLSGGQWKELNNLRSTAREQFERRMLAKLDRRQKGHISKYSPPSKILFHYTSVILSIRLAPTGADRFDHYQF